MIFSNKKITSKIVRITIDYTVGLPTKYAQSMESNIITINSLFIIKSKSYTAIIQLSLLYLST